MKNSFLLIIIILASCNSNKEESNNIQTMNSNNVQMSEVRHVTLSADQIAKIKVIQSTFEEVYPMSLEETITILKKT